VVRPDNAIRVATGSVSHTLCSEVFLAGQDPHQVFAEVMRPERGMGLIDWALRYEVDRARRRVRTTVAGIFESHAAHRAGMGCLLARGSAPAEDVESAATVAHGDAAVARVDEIAGPMPVEPPDERLRVALDHAFAEPDPSPSRRTKAVVVVHDGRIVAERYAPGYGVDTPLLGHSMTKSVVNAFIGILVRQGVVAVKQPAPVAAWQTAGDPRAAIDIDQLLGMVSGLPWDEYFGGWDPATRMWYRERDMAAFAEKATQEAPPRPR